MRLRTLGGVSVVTDEGEPLAGAATQRRLLALLAALAVAGDRGLSRDKLVGLLWPDVDEERGRHSLTQGLYAARRALGIDDLFVVGADIRLNRDRLQTDVGEMEEALDGGALEQAVSLYEGPFADGFFLPGSADFEEWSSGQRARLEDRVVGALDILARQAEESGRAREALAWRKRLAAIRPYDTSAAVALVNTLAHAGDRAGALQHARLHETMLREQLGLEPDPVMASLVARLREPRNWGTVEPWRPTPAGGVEEPPAEAVPGPVPGPHAPATRFRWWWVAVAAGVLLLSSGFFLLQWRRGPDRSLTPAPLVQKVVVAPFRVAGASASLQYLREGLVELLSTRLADDSAARSVDAGAVLAAWRAAGIGSTADVSRETVLRLAERLGAERVVLGSVVGTSSRVVLTAAVMDVRSRQSVGEAAVEGAADSLTVLVDRLAGRLLVLGAGEDASLSEQTSKSLDALRAFLDGQAAFRRGSYPAAQRWYEQALRYDSTFGLAAVQSAHTADRLQTIDARPRALALAWRERGALDARARALLIALAGPAYPAPSEAEDQVAAWERLVDLTPERAESWFELGARLILEGAVAGEANARARGALALRRALQLEPEHLPSRELLAWVPGALPTADSAGQLAPFLEWKAAIAAADSATLRRVRETLPELGPRNLRAIALAAQLEAAGPDDARRAVQQLRARAGTLDDRLDAILAEHALALNQGRAQEALAATTRLAELQPGARAHLRLRVLDALYSEGDSVAAEAAVRELRRSLARRAAVEPAARAVQLADACVLSQWRLAGGDTTGVAGAIGWLEAEPLRSAGVAPPVAAAPLACADLLRAGMAVVMERPDASAAVARVDSLAFTVGSSWDAIAYAPIFLARLHERLGETEAALAAVRRRTDLIGWPRYLTTAWREEGRYATLLGATTDARKAFERYLALRAKPDSALRDPVESVRRRLTALDGRIH